ncbi:unnamed protein product, partial [Aureobasidium pullulans]
MVRQIQFLEYAINKWSVDGKNWLLDRVMEDDKLIKQFVRTTDASSASEDDSNTAIPWNEAGISQYFKAVEKFKEQLKSTEHSFGSRSPKSSGETKKTKIGMRSRPRKSEQTPIYTDDASDDRDHDPDDPDDGTDSDDDSEDFVKEGRVQKMTHPKASIHAQQ